MALRMAFFAGLLCASGAWAGPQVVTASGAVEGVEKVGVQIFYGLPYAAPPVGDLRWRAPQPVTAWDGVRPAKAPASDCMQQPDAGEGSARGTRPSEDCLYLNLWRPDPTGRREPLPVLVWIHGGAYVNGGSSSPIYEASALARRGLIVVSLNYRLGRFGFFAHPALAAAGEAEVGNFGLLDMIAALNWVKANAAAFGGDPDDMTVMGQSAGGDAVMHILTAPRTAGLIQRAIVLSGDGRSNLLGGLRWDAPEGQRSALSVGRAFAEGQGIIGEGADALAALRALPAEAVAGGLSMSALGGHPELNETFVRGPIVDDTLVFSAPEARFASGTADAVPLLIGATDADVSEHRPPSDAPFSIFGDRAGLARAAYPAPGSTGELVATIGNDLTMQEPARFAARQMAALGEPAWRYRFAYVAAARSAAPSAGHASELPFLFGTLETRYPGAVTDKDTEVSRLFGDYIANFARSGDPNGPGLPNWPMQEQQNDAIMLFTRDGRAQGGHDPLDARLDLIEAITDAVP
ncbi:MAG: carboxylesterase [Cereibacter sphaeroides]|uniref:Carboxylic ester hydrolase n=1 Tax=Cereibacter sphaeroides TaxID=1063 RepID=A0A2W5S4G4_CERSP|nr:MAG: carboxylesterase [Cereibacter sphaeroides]